jgi:hybrid cluster-associated redox disulfide protein
MMIHEDMLILDILRRYPQTREIFARHAMACDRCMRAADGTLAEGARMHGVPMRILIRELEEAIAEGGSREGLVSPDSRGEGVV